MGSHITSSEPQCPHPQEGQSVLVQLPVTLTGPKKALDVDSFCVLKHALQMLWCYDSAALIIAKRNQRKFGMEEREISPSGNSDLDLIRS